MIKYNKNNLEFQECENNYQKPFYICLVICFILILSLSYSFHLLSIQNKIINEKTLNKCEIEKFNIESMKKLDSIINEMPFSDKITCKKQYRLESGHLASDLVKNNNNCFGMRASSRRNTYIGIDKNGYAIYSSIYMSIVDRLLYDIYVGTSLKNYASDPLYFKKLNIKK
jgi:hypothetical protein